VTAATLDRARLAKLLGMMGSVHDGEVVAAARQAERLRSDAGLTWRDIVLPALPAPGPQPATVADAIAFLLQYADALTDWEHDFVRSVAAQRYPFSAKQMEVLRRLVDKAKRAQARAA
jgi:hypothetical protein